MVDTLHLSEIINAYDNSQGGQALFHPVLMVKLLENTRVGSEIHKRYDKARTPYQRLREGGCESLGHCYAVA